MKFLDYSYVINKPLESVFNYLIDLEKVHNDVNLFKNAEVTSSGHPPEQIGKSYFIQMGDEEVSVTTIIRLIRIESPHMAMYEYTYDMRNENGVRIPMEEVPLMPWKTMTLIMGLQEDKNGKTRVTSVITANGITTLWGKAGAWFLSLFGRYQQNAVNKRVVDFINNHPI